MKTLSIVQAALHSRQNPGGTGRNKWEPFATSAEGESIIPVGFSILRYQDEIRRNYLDISVIFQ